MSINSPNFLDLLIIAGDSYLSRLDRHFRFNLKPPQGFTLAATPVFRGWLEPDRFTYGKTACNAEPQWESRGVLTEISADQWQTDFELAREQSLLIPEGSYRWTCQLEEGDGFWTYAGSHLTQPVGVRCK